MLRCDDLRRSTADEVVYSIMKYGDGDCQGFTSGMTLDLSALLEDVLCDESRLSFQTIHVSRTLSMTEVYVNIFAPHFEEAVEGIKSITVSFYIFAIYL